MRGFLDFSEETLDPRRALNLCIDAAIHPVRDTGYSTPPLEAFLLDGGKRSGAEGGTEKVALEPRRGCSGKGSSDVTSSTSTVYVVK